MNTIFALFFVFVFNDGTIKTEWAETYTSKQECMDKGKTIYDRVVKKLDATKDKHGLVRMEAGCVPQQGA